MRWVVYVHVRDRTEIHTMFLKENLTQKLFQIWEDQLKQILNTTCARVWTGFFLLTMVTNFGFPKRQGMSYTAQ